MLFKSSVNIVHKGSLQSQSDKAFSDYHNFQCEINITASREPSQKHTRFCFSWENRPRVVYLSAYCLVDVIVY